MKINSGEVRKTFKDFGDKVKELENIEKDIVSIEKEIDKLDSNGFKEEVKKEVSEIKNTKFNKDGKIDLDKIPEIRSTAEELKLKIKEKKEADSYYETALIHFNKKIWVEAKINAEKAKEIYRKIGYADGISKCNKLLSQIPPWDHPPPPINLERTLYDPVKRDFIISSPRPLPNIKNWIEKNDPSMYWFIICINNNSDKSIDEWGIKLNITSTLKILDARIEGAEDRTPRVRELQSEEHWLSNWVLGVPHTLGIVIPRKGSKRVYFKLGSDTCGVDYKIEGNVSTSDHEIISIGEKHFRYSCDSATLNVAIRTNPKDAEKYAETVLFNKYGKETALKLLNSFRIVQEIDRCCIPDKSGETKFSDKGYIDIKEKLHVLLGALDSAKVGDNLVRLVKDNLDMMSIAGETNASAERIRKLCGNLPDMWINEVLKI